MSDLKDLTWNPFKVTWVNSVGISLWVENECPYESDLRWVIWSNPIKMIRFNEKWMNWSEMSEMKWNEWFDGNDLEQPYGNGPMSRLRVSLWKWLDVSDLIKPFQNDQNRWEMNELKWIEVKWRIWRIWLCEPYGNGPMVDWECPYQNDLICLLWPNPFKMIRIDEKWMNRVNRGEMSEWMEMTWNNPMGMVLWSVEGVPIKVTWCEWKWVSLSKWMESMRNEWSEVNRGE